MKKLRHKFQPTSKFRCGNFINLETGMKKYKFPGYNDETRCLSREFLEIYFEKLVDWEFRRVHIEVCNPENPDDRMPIFSSCWRGGSYHQMTPPYLASNGPWAKTLRDLHEEIVYFIAEKEKHEKLQQSSDKKQSSMIRAWEKYTGIKGK